MDEKSKTITDGLGLKIDKGIRELIVLLNYNNIGTIGSCWGHKNWGLPYPWVDIHKEYLGDLHNILLDLDIEIEEFDFGLRISPINKESIIGRKVFNKLKKKLKKLALGK